MQLGRLALAAVLLVSAAVAQEFAPSKHVAHYDALVGRWEGSGKLWDAPDAEPRAFSFTMDNRKILDGHFVEENTAIRFGDGPDGAFDVRTIYGWDTARGEYVSYVASPFGMIRRTGQWPDESTMVMTSTTFEGGEVSIVREVSRFPGDTWEFEVHRAAGAGDFYLHVAGSATRTETGADTAHAAAAAAVEPNEHMKHLAPMVGTWRMKGTMTPMAGMPPMELEATEHYDYVFGGAVLANHVVGEPTAMGPFVYEGIGLLAWNDHLDKWEQAWFDNMGGSYWGSAYKGGKGRMVFMTAGKYFGMPSLERSILEMDENGMIRLATHRLMATNDPETSFEVTYERVE